MTPTRFRIGDWTVLPTEGVVERGTDRRHLRPKAMDLLLLLAETPGETVTKTTIMERLWPDASVEEGSLAVCVSQLRSVLDDNPQKPRFIQTRHRRGYRLIAEVEAAAVEPYATDSSMPGLSVPTKRPLRARRARVLGGVLIACLAAAAVMAFFRSEPRVGSLAPNATSHAWSASPRVVVLGATHLDGDASFAWIGRAVAHLLTTELASTTALRLVPADASWRSEGELAVTRSETLNPEALVQMQRRFGVDLVISGHYVVTTGESDDLRLDLVVTDAGSGEILSAVAEHGPSTRLGEVVTLAAVRLREDLDLPALVPERSHNGSTLDQASFELPPAYFQGLVLLERLEAQRARERFQLAIAQEPEAPWPHLALAESWGLLGYDRNAAESVAEALARAWDLQGEERLWFESRAHALSTDWDQAIERLEALRLLDPGNLEYSLALLGTLVGSGRVAEALVVIEESSEPTDDRSGEDPRWALLRGEVALAMGERAAALEAARVALVRSRGLQAPVVEARALFLEARVLRANGEVGEAETILDTARQRFILARDRSGEAQTNVTLSQWLSRHGERERAVTAVRAALAISLETGDRSGEGDALRALGPQAWMLDGREKGEAYLREAIQIARETGDRSAEANALSALAIALARFSTGEPMMPYFREALAIHRELGNRERIGSTLMNIGRLAMLEGDLDEARASFEEAETVEGDLDPEARGLIAFNLGYLRSLTGDPVGARDAFHQGLTLFRRLNDANMEDACLEALGSAALAAGDLELAFDHIRTVLAMREARGDGVRIARAKVVLSRVLLASDEMAEAERFARQALEESQIESAGAVRPAAIEVLALVLLEAGRAEEAHEAIGLGPGFETNPLEWPTISYALYDLTRARIDAALGRQAEALERATALRGYFDERGASALVLEAEFVLLEVDLRHRGRLDTRRAKALETAARAEGQELIARRAAALAKAEPGQG